MLARSCTSKSAHPTITVPVNTITVPVNSTACASFCPDLVHPLPSRPGHSCHILYKQERKTGRNHSTCIHTYLNAYTHTYVHTHIHPSIHPCIHPSKHTSSCVIQTCIHYLFFRGRQQYGVKATVADPEGSQRDLVVYQLEVTFFIDHVVLNVEKLNRGNMLGQC